MKNLLISLLCLSVLLLNNQSTQAQTQPIKTQAPVISLFQPANEAARSAVDLSEHITSYTLLSPKMAVWQQLMQERPASLSLTLPFEGGMTLELEQSNPLAPDFILTASNATGGKDTLDYQPGLHYSGKIAGMAHSLVAISIFDDQIIGVISDEESNINLGRVNTDAAREENIYVMFRDKDLVTPLILNCGTEQELDIETVDFSNLHEKSQFLPNCPVRIYLDCDYNLYTSNGNNITNTANLAIANFNIVVTIYANENIPLVVSETHVWTSNDPFPNTNSEDQLNALRDYYTNNSLNGHFACLLVPEPWGRGWRDVFCNTPYSNNVSGWMSSPNPFPTYTQSVATIAHELGHNFGSPHTHNCIWPGGPIDNCAAVDDGPCNPGPAPVNGGTIMSYCQTIAPFSLANGFGPLPGNLIRTNYQNATCVNAPPATNYTFNVNSQTVTFTNTSTNATSYTWNLGDGQTSTQTSPIHTYATPGNYNVCLIATGTCGTATSCQTVSIAYDYCWHWQNPKPFVVGLKDNFFVNSTTGWSIGELGLIIKTTDAGTSWQQQNSGTTKVLYGIHFVDNQTGWVVGQNGTILKTNNAGSNWAGQNIEPINVNDVYFTNTQTGWVVGSGGKIFKTTDGGSTWLPQISGTTESLLSIFFFNNQTGWAVGGGGEIIKTIDGGGNWTQQTSGTTQLIYSIQFINLQTGWAVGNSGLILKSMDGGATWIAQVSGTTVYLNDVHFINDQIGWAAGGAMLKTADGGITWIPQASAAFVSLNNIESVHFVDAQKGWAVGGNDFYSALFNTIDGGNTWQYNGTSYSDELNAWDIQFIDKKTGWVSGGHGKIGKTTDGGISWQPKTVGGSALFDELYFIDTLKGWVVGDSGMIYKSIDGGETWQFQTSGTQKYLSSVFANSEQNAWAVGNGGTILKTNNGGTTWQQVISNTSNDLLKIFFLNSQLGWAVGNGGTVLKSTNGGNSWQIAGTPGAGEFLKSVWFVDNMTGWAVGYYGEIFKTIDAGQTWQILFSTNNYLTNDIHFINNQLGWVIGSNTEVSAIFYTNDGGSTWKEQAPLPVHLYNIFFIDQNNGWVSGWGKILKLGQPAKPVVQSLTLCRNTPEQPLTATGTNLLWYTNSTGGTGSPTAPTPNTTTIGTTTYYVSQSPIGIGNCTESERTAITVSVTAPSVSVSTVGGCSGNGSATAVGSGSAAPYTFQWNNNQTTATINNLAPGTYSVTVTDANGCTNTTTATVSSGAAPQATISNTQSTCPGQNGGSATVAASGGIAPYTYHWSNNQNTATASSLAAGNYTVTVTGSNGCTATATATVGTATAPTATIAPTTPACSGQSNGSATVTASGGVPPYTYHWFNNQNTATASNLTAGTYTVTVTGSNGCTTTAAATIGTAPATTSNFTFSANAQSVSFTNASTNATSYSWDFGDGQTATQPSPSHTYANAGVYEVCLAATGVCGGNTFCQTITFAPPGWDVEPCNTGIVHTVGILSDAITSIVGQPLEPGDFVGFFHTDASGANICNNFGTWQGTALVLELCGDNPATPSIKEGFALGENFLVKVWKNNTEHNVIACYVPKDAYGANNPSQTGSFAIMGLSYVECLKTPPAPGTDLGCSSPIPIACGETKTGNTANGISSSISYNCFYNLVDGPEVVYEFINPIAQNVLITLSGLQEDLEVLLLDACDRNSCLFYSDRTGTIPEALLANNLPAGTYYIIVDGYLGSDSPYSLNVTCGSNGTNNSTLNCSGAITAQCGQTVSGTTSTGSDQIVQYGCSPTYNSGKEKIYTLTLPENKVVGASLFGLSADLNLLVLDACNPNACVAISEGSGTQNEGVLFFAAAGKTYYIVVDGYFDAEGPYSLSISCGDPCTDPADCPPNDYDLNGPGGGTGGGTPCELAHVLECGVPISGNNNSGNAYADSYSCPNSYTTGKEVIYKFTIDETQDVTLILSGLSANLDLYLLDDCSVFNCHAASHKIGTSDEGMVVQALAAGTYYVVVDGYNGAAISGYSLLVNCTNSALTCQTIDLVAGTNFISSNILPLDPAIGAMFPPSAQSKIISIESQTNLSYSPNAQTDPAVFGDWDFRKAYRIKALEAVSVEVCGEKADPDTPIPFVALTPQGQAVNNWSAYLKDDPAQVGDKFTPTLTPKIFRVWNMPTGPNGTLMPQSWSVTLQAGAIFQLTTGRGYILNATEDGEYSFGFWRGGSDSRSGHSGLPLVVENGCTYFQTPFFNSMKAVTVILPKTVLEEGLSFGDEIGVFRQDGSLFGSGKYNGFALSLVIGGDETATPDFLEGFSEGEAMVFRLWKSVEGKVFDLKATFQSGNGDFENEAVYFVDGLEVLEPSAVQTPKMMLDWAVYPNPARETIWFDLLLPQASNVHLELFSTDGRQLRNFADHEMPAGRTVLHAQTDKLVSGCYLVKMTTEQGVSFKKIIISKN